MTIEESVEPLPEGISINIFYDKPIILDLEEEVTNSTSCNQCGLSFESVLVKFASGKNEGMVRVVGNPSPAWKSSMPKDRVRCIKLLNEALVKKIDTHGKMMHND